ncbi:hypothetical protein, partial [Salinibacterium sp.]|uniref:hypothetical protein n=1 Tax=Salinibacterium sp. TaxID=1915057 RepID=UPI00286C3520
MKSPTSTIDITERRSYESRRALAVLAQRINGSIVSQKRLRPGVDPEENVRDFVEKLDWRLPEDLHRMGADYRASSGLISQTLSAVLDDTLNTFSASVQISEHVIEKCIRDWKRAGGPWRKTDALIR